MLRVKGTLALTGIAVAATIAGALVVILPNGSSGDQGNPDLSESAIVGVWRSPAGGEFSLSSDGVFTGRDVTLSYACDPQGVRTELERVSGRGRWGLGSFRDEGNGARVEFRPEGGPVALCDVWLVFSGSESSPVLYFLHDDGTGEVYRRAE